MTLVALEFPSTDNFNANLYLLKELVRKTPPNSLIGATEVALTGFAYKNRDKVDSFLIDAVNQLLPLLEERILIFTAMCHHQGQLYNTLITLTREGMTKGRSKIKLFPLGEEEDYFIPERKEAHPYIQIINGMKVGYLICYELRFLELWEKLRGVDVIIICAQWGKERKSHLETLSRALALQLQCFVITANGNSEEMAGSSMVITPWDEKIDACQGIASLPYNEKEIKKSRRAFRLCEQKN